MTVGSGRAADLDRRLGAYVLDRMLGWGIAAALGYGAWKLFAAPDRVWVGVLVGVVVLAVLNAGHALLLGTTGLSPGKAALGLRVVGRDDGRPVGVLPAFARVAVVGIGGLPTLGLGVATLAWTAASDPQRRGLHDRLGNACVIDVRAAARVAASAPDTPAGVVNLTALRLAPGPDSAPVREATPAPPPVGAEPPPPPPGALTSPTVRRQLAGDVDHDGRWWVEFDTGESFAVAGLVLLGRRPEPRPGEEMWRGVALRSDDMSISKTHAQFQVTPQGSLIVMDRGSTNGTHLVRQGVSRPLSPGRPTTLLPGDRVRFGDREMLVTQR